MSELKKPEKKEYKANFLWPPKDNSIESILYEFANAKTEEYRKVCYKKIIVNHNKTVKALERELKAVKEGNVILRDEGPKMQQKYKGLLERAVAYIRYTGKEGLTISRGDVGISKQWLSDCKEVKDD